MGKEIKYLFGTIFQSILCRVKVSTYLQPNTSNNSQYTVLFWSLVKQNCLIAATWIFRYIMINIWYRDWPFFWRNSSFHSPCMKNSSENVSEWQENMTGQNGGCEQVWCQGWTAWSEAFHLFDSFQKLRAQVVAIVSVIWNKKRT